MEVRCVSYAALPYFVSSEEITLRDFGRAVQVTSELFGLFSPVNL